MKTCTKCKEEKELTQFHLNSKEPCGRQARCKMCVSSYQHKHYLRPGVKERVKQCSQKLFLENPELRQQRRKQHRKRYPERRSARQAVCYAIRVGSIIKPRYCSACGGKCVPDGHHADYAKKLEVTWLCKQCHMALHRKENHDKS